MHVKLRSIALAAVRKRFSPEFVNRIDVVLTYPLLDDEALRRIVDHHIRELQEHVNSCLADRGLRSRCPRKPAASFCGTAPACSTARAILNDRLQAAW